MAKFKNDDWILIDDALPLKKGRYQVAILRGGRYYVTMRKYNPERLYYKWERNTCGIRYWKPMSDLPNGCQPLDRDLDPALR